MKTTLIALAILGFTYCGANAQTYSHSCGVISTGKVCRQGKGGASCYKTRFAENYKVCKGDFGYYICCETPNRYNTTNAGYIVRNNNNDERHFPAEAQATAYQQPDLTPQSQSYAYDVNTVRSYEGYYNKRGSIKVCYTGDNVALENENPYKGCPSPQFDGPDANNTRNINVSNPVSLPPINGRSHE